MRFVHKSRVEHPGQRVVQFQPIQYVTLAHRVYRAIKDRILNQEIPLGARLRDEELAAQLGVSRTPVREALMTLTREGLVEIVPRSQTRVRTFTEKDIEDIFDLRIALETLAIRKSIEQFVPAQVKQLYAMHRKAEAALKKGNVTVAVEFDIELHRIILDLCDNRKLQEVMGTIRDYVTLFRNVGATTAAHRGFNYRHHEILKALEHEDAEGAVRALTEHLIVAKEQTLRDFQERDFFSSLKQPGERAVAQQEPPGRKGPRPPEAGGLAAQRGRARASGKAARDPHSFGPVGSEGRQGPEGSAR